jgi:membrane protease YdiL (CAAX protease family)
MSTLPSERPRLQSALAIVSALGLGAGGLGFGFALAALVVVLIILTTGTGVSNFAFIVISLTFVQGVGCIGVALAYYKLRPVVAPRIRSKLGLSGDASPFSIPASIPGLKDLLVVFVGYFGAFGVVITGSILITVAQSVSGSQVNTGSNQVAELGRQNPEILLLLIPASIFLIGPGEELLFRGVVQGRIRERFSPVPGILIPSAIFGGLHWFALTGGSLTGNVVVLVLLTCVALVLGISYEYTGNIVVPSLIHGFYNATLFTLLYISLTYSEQLQQQAALLGL